MKDPPKGDTISDTGGPSDALASTALGTAGASPIGTSELRRLAADARIAERYAIVRFLAAGAMGEVYEARDRMLDVSIALKTIRPDVANEPHMVERFKREIQLARKVTHANVCRTFEVGVDAGVVFLTMELLAGETLAERIRRSPGGKLTVAEARPLVAQLAAGLAAAHEAGVVHRDFKPHNVILVESKGSGGIRAVVTDFGVARGTQEDPGAAMLTGAADLIGTPAYMAPEQVNGAQVGPASDVYALGLVMYEMVTGRLPFSGKTPLAVASARLTEPVAAPSTLVPGIDAAFEAVILACLARDPAARPTMIAIDGAVLGGRTIEAPPVATAVSTRPGAPFDPAAMRRRRSARRLIGTIAIAAAVTAGWALRSHHAPAPAAPKVAAPDTPPDANPALTDEARALYDSGQAAYLRGDYATAVHDFDKAVALLPRPELYFNVAQAYRKSGDTKDALFYFKRYLELSPDAPGADQTRQWIAELEQVTASGVPAVPDAGPAETLPQRADARFRAGLTAYRNSDFAAAAQAFEEAYALSPAPEVLRNISLSYEMAGDPRQAAAFLRQYLDGAPDVKDRPLLEKRYANLTALAEKGVPSAPPAPPEARPSFDAGPKGKGAP